jgi:hypothetical protein
MNYSQVFYLITGFSVNLRGFPYVFFTVSAKAYISLIRSSIIITPGVREIISLNFPDESGSFIEAVGFA